MNRSRTRLPFRAIAPLIALAAALALVSAACSSGGSGGGQSPTGGATTTTAAPTTTQPSPSPSPEAGLEVDLAAVVLGPDDSPGGATYDPDFSGPKPLEEVWQSDCCQDEQTAFRENGFVESDGSFFFNAEGGTALYFAWSVANLFEDEAGASAALRISEDFFRSDRRTLAVGTDFVGEVEDLPDPGLGDESSAIRYTFGFEGPDEGALYAYFWRIGPLALHARGGGLFFEADDADIAAAVLAMAEEMHARATA